MSFSISRGYAESYKRRKTPTILTELRQKEDELNMIEEKAKQKWTEEVREKSE